MRQTARRLGQERTCEDIQIVRDTVRDTLRTAPAVGYSLIKDGDKRTPTNQVVYHGLQPATGLYLNKVDLDTTWPGVHKTPGQDAHTARAAFERKHPAIAAKMDWRPTEHGGLHGYFLTNGPMLRGKIYDTDGRHIGEMISGDTDTSILPDNLQPGRLSPTERDHMLRTWHVADATQRDGGTWRNKATEGERLARGYSQHRITKVELRAFLQAHGGEPGKHLDALFDSRKLFDRSNAAGSLMQCLMFNIHKLLPMCGNSERCALAMAYWMAADSYGKAGSKEYNQEIDGFALIEKIVNERPKEDGTRWRAPFWAKAHPMPSAPANSASVRNLTPAQPAHRPAGDHEKHLATFRRVLESIQPDDFGRRVYTLEYLSDRMRTAKSPAKPRTIQAYLQDLRKNGEIATAQIGGNGRPYAVLTSCFGGANKSKKAAVSAPKPGSADERIATPQTVQTQPQCKEDHLNSGAPPPVGYDATGRRLGLTDLVRDGLDAYPRASFKRVRAYVLANAANPQAYSEGGVLAVYQRELKRRHWEKQNAKLIEQVRKLRADVLKRKSQSTASRAAQLRKAGNRQAPIWQRIAGVYASEESRRTPTVEQVTTRDLWADVDMEAYDQAHRQLQKQAGPVGRAAPGGAQASLGDLPRGGLRAAEAPPVVAGTAQSLIAWAYAREGLHSDAERIL